MKNTETQYVMCVIGTQLRKARDKEYLIELLEDSTHISATFNKNIRNFTIEMVLRHLREKYGKYVIVVRSESDPSKFDIWEMCN